MQQKTKSQQTKKHFKWGMMAFALVMILSGVAMVMIGSNLPSTAESLALELTRNPAEAILTSANVGDGTVVAIPVTYYAQQPDECVNMYDLEMRDALKARQFEWSNCGYYETDAESGLVDYDLDENHLPVATGGVEFANRGIKGDNFRRWFNAVDGKNEVHTGTLSLAYNEETTGFEFGSDEFYPLSSIGTGVDTSLFTMNFGIPIRVMKSGDESFTIVADDDTWVFVDDKLVLDMGGIHEPVSGFFKINKSGEIYAAVDEVSLAYTGVLVDDNAVVRVFHANRDSANSVMRMKFANVVLSIMNNSGLATNDEGVQLAYDPNDSAYAMPLGESLSVKSGDAKAFMVTLVIQVVALGAFATIMAVAILAVWRYWRRDHIRVK